MAQQSLEFIQSLSNGMYTLRTLVMISKNVNGILMDCYEFIHKWNNYDIVTVHKYVNETNE